MLGALCFGEFHVNYCQKCCQKLGSFERRHHKGWLRNVIPLSILAKLQYYRQPMEDHEIRPERRAEPNVDFIERTKRMQVLDHEGGIFASLCT